MGIWFDTGLFMNDGKSKRTVYANSETEAKEFFIKGWMETEKKPEVKKKRVVKKISQDSAAGKKPVRKTGGG